MKRFLKAIDLDDEEDDKDGALEEQLQPADNKKYSILFLGLQTIERLIGLEWAQKMGAMKHVSTLGLAKKCQLFAQYHAVHWIRLISSRILGQLFSYHNG